MTGPFLRASLFTSVVAFGVAAMAVGIGILFALLGWALMGVGKSMSDSAYAAPWPKHSTRSDVLALGSLARERVQPRDSAVPRPVRRNVLKEIVKEQPWTVQETAASQFRSETDYSIPSWLHHAYAAAVRPGSALGSVRRVA